MGEAGNIGLVSTKRRKKAAREENKWEIGGGEDCFGLHIFFRLSCETEASALTKLCFRLQSYFKKIGIFKKQWLNTR